MKRIVSMLLALVLVVGMLPMGVFAETEETPDTSASQAQTPTPDKSKTQAPATTTNTSGASAKDSAQNTASNGSTPGADKSPEQAGDASGNKNGNNDSTAQNPSQSSAPQDETKKSAATGTSGSQSGNGDPSPAPDSSNLTQNPGQDIGNSSSSGNKSDATKKDDNELGGNSKDEDQKGKDPDTDLNPVKTPGEDEENANNGQQNDDDNLKPAPLTLTRSGGDGGDGQGDGGEGTEIDLSSLTNLTKTYDGNNTVDITSAANGILSGKNVTLTATLESADAGTRKITGVTVAKNDDADDAEYTVTGWINLTVTIEKATVLSSGSNSTNFTVYKNVPNTYSVDLAQLIGNSGLRPNNHFMSLSGYTLKDNGSSLSASPSGSFTPGNITQNKLSLAVTGDFTGFDDSKNSITYTVSSKNYNDFDYTITFQAADLTHKVNFDANGGMGQMNSLDVPYNQATPLTANSFTRENYDFTGWNTKADGAGASFSDNGSITISETTPQTLTLYAQWKPKEYKKPKLSADDVKNLLKNVTVTYLKYGASADDPNSSVKVNLRDLTGYTWLVSGDDVKGYQLTITMTQAAWKSGENDAAQQLGGEGETWKLYPTPEKPYAQNVVFTYTIPSAEDGDDEVTTMSLDDGDAAPTISPWTLSSESPSIYMNQYFTVTYQMDTDAPHNMLNKSVQYPVAKGEAVPEFTATEDVYTTNVNGYTFLGWVRAGSQDEPQADPRKENEKVTGNITYTGKWKQHKFTISFNKGAEDASGSMENITVAYDSATSLPACAFTRPGYRFVHWSRVVDNTTVTYDDQRACGAMTDKDGETITLTAQWVPVVTKVDFTLSGYGQGKKVTGIGVTTGTKGVSFGGGYGNGFHILEGSTSITGNDATFGANKTYRLVVNFSLDDGYEDGGMTKNTVRLNGRAAIEFRAPEEVTESGAQTYAAGENIPESGIYTAVFQLPAIREIKVYLMTKNGTVEVTGASYSGDAGVYYAMDGDKVTFKVTPAKGYVCYTLKVDGKSQKISTGKYTLTVSDNHVVKIWFAKDSGNAKTGDDIRLVYLAAAGVISLAALTALAVVGLKKKKK